MKSCFKFQKSTLKIWSPIFCQRKTSIEFTLEQEPVQMDWKRTQEFCYVCVCSLVVWMPDLTLKSWMVSIIEAIATETETSRREPFFPWSFFYLRASALCTYYNWKPICAPSAVVWENSFNSGNNSNCRNVQEFTTQMNPFY